MATAEEKLKKQIGNRIKNLRLQAGYTSQEAFAYDANIPRAQYGRYESGRSNITIASLLKITSFHKITFAEFFKEGFGN
ncbi:MAG: hypothetical protein K0S44_1151 [Bacteroidetes bacterium]|jgi:transcriptional regulator with XRE-family HTH domain|nr:hypothetical protein [Bacteroidota bacterium]